MPFDLTRSDLSVEVGEKRHRCGMVTNVAVVEELRSGIDALRAVLDLFAADDLGITAYGRYE